MKIIISGTVGVGKTTISKLLETTLQKENKVTLNLELSQENPYLSYYYEDRSSWSYLIQLDYMLARFKTLFIAENLLEKDPDNIIIFDRHFLDDFIFGSMKMIKEDMSIMQWNQYAGLTETLVSQIDPNHRPDYFFLLQANFENIIYRIQKRARVEEQNVDYNYWRNLYHQYYNNDEIITYLRSNVKRLIHINTNDKSPNEIVQEILNYLKK